MGMRQRRISWGHTLSFLLYFLVRDGLRMGFFYDYTQ